LGNWLECLECPHLCTKACPIEGENVIEDMNRQISNANKERTYFEK
jgi:hypothetical protein